MSSSAKQTAPHEVPSGARLVLYACLPASLGKAADHSVASTRRYVADAGWETVDDACRPGSTTNRSDHPDRRGTAMTATTLSPITTATTEASVVTAVLELPADPFDIDLTIVTEIDSDLLPKACGTGDGCKPSCASSCASAV
jgi:FxLD family lantipeptide